MRPSSFLYPSPTSPILRRKNNGAMIHFDRQQSTQRSENAWSPQPSSPTKTVKTLTPEDFVSAERLDPDHDVSSITWYPFDWRTGGPNRTYSPLRKLPFTHSHHIPLSSICRPPRVNPCHNQKYIMNFSTLDHLNPFPSLMVAHRLLTRSTNPTLDSPVNRAQAHNPLGKRHSQQSVASENNVDFGAYLGSSPSPSPMFTRMVSVSPLEFPALPPSVSPSASLVCLSPVAVPLPSPSPDEATELDSVN